MQPPEPPEPPPNPWCVGVLDFLAGIGQAGMVVQLEGNPWAWGVMLWAAIYCIGSGFPASFTWM
jgi:hypothetical protein